MAHIEKRTSAWKVAMGLFFAFSGMKYQSLNKEQNLINMKNTLCLNQWKSWTLILLLFAIPSITIWNIPAQICKILPPTPRSRKKEQNGSACGSSESRSELPWYPSRVINQNCIVKGRVEFWGLPNILVVRLFKDHVQTFTFRTPILTTSLLPKIWTSNVKYILLS